MGGKKLAVHSQRGWPGNSPGYKGRLLAPSNVSALSAACLMIRKELFRSHSGFDERLAVSYGDVDLCLRLGRAGYYHILLTHIRLIHAESASRGYDTSAEKRARLREESGYLTNLHPQLAYGDPFYNPNFSEARGDFSLRIT